MRFLKFLLGLALLPLCWAASTTHYLLVEQIYRSSTGSWPLSVWGLLIGFALWLILFFSLPKPMVTYVFAHELTHALWAWIMGARVSRLKVSARGGSVTLDKTNFVIALAPYFFPLYTILVIIGFYALALFFDLHTYEPFWLGLIGLTWCFHLTFTIRTLLQHQPDIHQHGRVFSYSIIYLANVLGVALWIVLIASPSLQTLAQVLGRETVDAYLACRDAGLMIWEKVGTALQAVR